MKHSYGFRFEYRQEKDGEAIKDCFFIESKDPDGENACTIAMLQFLKKHDYYSGRIVSWTEYKD